MEFAFTHFQILSTENSVIGFGYEGRPVYKVHMGSGTGWVKIRSTNQWLKLPQRVSEQLLRKIQQEFKKLPVHRFPQFVA